MLRGALTEDKKTKGGNYKVTLIKLREITKCTDDQKKAVRDVRNQENVRKSMYKEHEIPLDEHLAWVERLISDKQKSYLLFLRMMW